MKNGIAVFSQISREPKAVHIFTLYAPDGHVGKQSFAINPDMSDTDLVQQVRSNVKNLGLVSDQICTAEVTALEPLSRTVPSSSVLVEGGLLVVTALIRSALITGDMAIVTPVTKGEHAGKLVHLRTSEAVFEKMRDRCATYVEELNDVRID